MTEQTNAELIAESRDFVQLGSGINIVEADRLIEELSRELEAAEKRATEAERQVEDRVWNAERSRDTQLVRTAELAAVIETVGAETEELRAQGYPVGVLLRILASAPADALREHDAKVRAEEREKAAGVAEDAPGTEASGYYSGDHQMGYQEAQSWIADRIREQGS